MIYKQKKAAIELSIGTIVIIVLAMSMLILGLVLVKNIFRVATDSISTLDDKVRKELSSLFSDEGKDVVVLLGSDKNAKIRVNTQNFGVGIAAKTSDGSPVGDRKRMKYRLSLDTSSAMNCVKKMGDKNVRSLISQPVEKWINFDEFDGENAYAIIQFNIPKGTPICSQKIFVDVQDSKQVGVDVMSGTAFSIEVISRVF